MYHYDGKLTVEPAYYSDGVPVFAPTMKQFQNFYQFNKAINKYGMESGIVKIIPPSSWVKSTKGCYCNEQLEKIIIKNPIVQHINGQQPGVYSQQNVEKQRSYNIYQWKQISEQTNYLPPAPKGKLRSSEVESRLVDRKDDKAYNIDISSFTEERCEELEKNYWRTLTYAEPMYGADMLGSIFPGDMKCWNVGHLPNILDLLKEKLPGVNDAYLYAGLWKATFAWHLEDQDLYSINYLHFGAPKQWYSIPQSNRGKFFDLMKETFNDEYKNCAEFLRHKTFLVSPQFLEKHGIQYNKIVHRQGEFIITYPYGYHAGFNYGYNLAESVNFAIDDWFAIGETSKKCECIPDAVAINIRQLYCDFKGIPYEYKSSSESPEEKDQEVSVSKPRKIRAKRRSTTQASTKLTSIPDVKGSDCSLCPNSFNGLPLQDNSFFNLLNSDSQQKVHRICARMFPKELHFTAGTVTGMANISKGQQKLKCMVCKRMDGHSACFQCTQPKCVRSFHGTCGLMDGVLYDFATGKAQCKYHRKKQSKQVSELVEIKPGSWVQFLFNKRNYFGKVISNYKHEHSVLTLVYPEYIDYLEIAYKDIIATYEDNDIYSRLPMKRNSLDFETNEPIEISQNYTFKSVSSVPPLTPMTKRPRNDIPSIFPVLSPAIDIQK